MATVVLINVRGCLTETLVGHPHFSLIDKSKFIINHSLTINT